MVKDSKISKFRNIIMKMFSLYCFPDNLSIFVTFHVSRIVSIEGIFILRSFVSVRHPFLAVAASGLHFMPFVTLNFHKASFTEPQHLVGRIILTLS